MCYSTNLRNPQNMAKSKFCLTHSMPDQNERGGLFNQRIPKTSIKSIIAVRWDRATESIFVG